MSDQREHDPFTASRLLVGLLETLEASYQNVAEAMITIGPLESRMVLGTSRRLSPWFKPSMKELVRDRDRGIWSNH